MDNTNELIINSLKYYDINTEKYSKLFNKAKYYSRISANQKGDLDHHQIILYDENKKEILKSRYEILGIYYFNLKLWVWGWSMPTLRKNEIILSKKILNYGIDLDLDSTFLKSELVISRFRISDEIQLDIHVAIASYISKNPMIFKVIYPPLSSEESENDSDSQLHELRTEIADNSIIYFIYLLDNPQ
jgi:hypothetical protein